MDSISNNGSGFANVQSVALDARQTRGETLEVDNRSRQTNTVDNSQDSALEKESQANRLNADIIGREESPEIELAVSELQDFVRQSNLTLQYRIDERTEQPVVTLQDRESGDVIRQIPSEELLDIAAQVKQITSENGSAVGLLVNGKV